MKTQQTEKRQTFYGLGIAPGLLEILNKLKFVAPTPIQHHAIPVALEGKDIVGVAQTGTGKTLAFGIPIIQILARHHKGSRGLVVLPTRELAMQVNEVLQKIGRSIGLRTAVLIGGLSMNAQNRDLAKNPHIIVATPGRLIDHLEQRTISLNNVKVLVLDEADRMLDMGFQPQIQKILRAVPKDRQTMLFSATLSPEIMNIATITMKLPLRIEVAPSGTTIDRVIQEIFIVKKEAKSILLQKVLEKYKGSALVFTRTKYGAKRVAYHLRASGHNSAEIHSNRSLVQRREALDGFKAGKYRVLVATDIASRGIDVVGIELVINYDLPSQAEDYVHRIGRTGRAGAEGRAISFAMPEEESDIRAIERLIRKNLKISSLPNIPSEITETTFYTPVSRPRNSRRGGRGGGPRRMHYAPRRRR